MHGRTQNKTKYPGLEKVKQMKEPTIYSSEDTDITTEATLGQDKKKTEKSVDNCSSEEKNSRTEPIVITSQEQRGLHKTSRQTLTKR